MDGPPKGHVTQHQNNSNTRDPFVLHGIAFLYKCIPCESGGKSNLRKVKAGLAIPFWILFYPTRKICFGKHKKEHEKAY